MLLLPHISGCHAATILHPMQFRGGKVSIRKNIWEIQLGSSVCVRGCLYFCKRFRPSATSNPKTECDRSDSWQEYPKDCTHSGPATVTSSPRNGNSKLTTVASPTLNLTLRSSAERTKEEYSSSSVIQASPRGYAMRRMSPKVWKNDD